MNGLLHHFISVQKIPVQKCFFGSCSRNHTTILCHFSNDRKPKKVAEAKNKNGYHRNFTLSLQVVYKVYISCGK